jgi:DNA processing protein
MRDEGPDLSPTPSELAGRCAAALGLAWTLQSGNHSLLRLLGRVGPQELWSASRRRLAEWGLQPASLARFLEARRHFSLAEARDRLQAAGIDFVPYGGELYPREFTHLTFPPAGLFVRGKAAVLHALLRVPRVTIVGTRRATPYGLRATEAFTAAFSAMGVAVVSGLALGIDGQAHRGALARGGLTAAVLGCGVDVVYPRRHWRLYEAVLAEGVLLSEFPPGTPPSRWTFPQRNRLLAALGDAVLVVEGSRTSGALQTATEAACLGRPVFAVPGPVDVENNRGCNQLLYEGALPAIAPEQTVQDFLGETRIARGERSLPAIRRASTEDGRQGTSGSSLVAAPPEEHVLVLSWLSRGPSSVEDIALATGLSARRVAVALSELELEGSVKQSRPGTYIRAP